MRGKRVIHVIKWKKVRLKEFEKDKIFLSCQMIIV